MAKVTGPLFSLGATQTIGKTLTYASWKGVDYVRTRVIPANPQTTRQTEVRNLFATLNAIWNRSPALFRAPFLAAALGIAKTDRNLFIGRNVAAMDGAATSVDFVHSLTSGGAVPPAGATFTPGAGQITIAVTAPPLPSGWTIQAALGSAVADWDPGNLSSKLVYIAEDLSSPYSIVLTSLGAGLTYHCGAYLRWLAPDNSVRYSSFLDGDAVPT